MAYSIAVDIMGGDYAPQAVLEGVRDALDMYGDDYHLILCGPDEQIRTFLKECGKAEDSRVEIVNAPEVVGMDEHPVHAVRNKRDSSIMVAMDMVKQKRADAVFSAGNTGAAVAAAFFKWRMLPGIDRPAIATQIPSEKDPFLLLDAGATVDCTPAMLLQFAIMGSVYAKNIMRRPAPRIGLLANGTEETKGNKQVQDTYPLLKQCKELNFIGNVEGHDLYAGGMDVVVCDGFVGNVVLKCAESLGKAIGHIIKRNMGSNPLRMLGGVLSHGAFGELKKKMDFAEIGGAPLLGVNGVCIIGHGISDARAVRNGIRACGDFLREDINAKIAEATQNISYPL